jgi:hypothetical protein
LTPLPKELDLFIAKLQQSTNYVIIELSLLFFTPRQFSIWRNCLHLGLLGWLAGRRRQQNSGYFHGCTATEE